MFLKIEDILKKLVMLGLIILQKEEQSKLNHFV